MREVRLNAGKAARFRASRGRLAGSIACDLHEVRFVVVEDAQRRDPASESLGIGGMSVKGLAWRYHACLVHIGRFPICLPRGRFAISLKIMFGDKQQRTQI